MSRSSPAVSRGTAPNALAALAVFAFLAAAGSVASAADADDCAQTDSEKAVAACTRIIESGKEKGAGLGRYYYNRGTTYSNLGKAKEAVADLTRSIELRKDHANSYYNRALAYRLLGDHDRSIADFTVYIRLVPKEAAAYHARGRSHRLKSDFERAIADLSESLRLKPDDADALYDRGLSYQEKGDLARAIADFERMVKLNARNDTAHAALGKLLSEQGEDKKALSSYDEAIRIVPGNVDYFIARGDIYVKLKNMDSALADYQSALRADPASSVAASHVGWALAEKSDHAQAVEYHGQAIRLDPENPDHYNNRGWSLYQQNNYARARTDFDSALKLKPDHELALINRGMALNELAQFDAAIADFDAAERVNPKAQGVRIHRGWSHIYLRNFDAAQAEFQAVADADADNIDAHNGLCWTLGHKDRFDNATGHCDKAVALSPTNTSVLHSRGVIKLRMGLHALALADFDRAVEIEPKNAGLYAERGRAHEARGDRARALADYQKAATLSAEGHYYNAAKEQAIKRLSELAVGSAQVQVAVAAPQGPAKPAAPEKRVALVIGNSAYRNVAALSNPKNDAGAVAASLRRLGFNHVVEKYDLSRQETTAALQAFGEVAEDADWAVIYYAGHGIEIGGVNYVIPIDAALKASNHVDDEALSLDRVMSTVGTAKKMKLVILDACRDNPFVPKMRTVGASRSVGRGLGRIDPPPGVLVAYAARDGLVAMDGEAGNSPFATALVEHMEEPGVEINLLFRKVRDAVFGLTKGKQEPFTYGSLPAQQFFFKTN